MSVCFLNVPAHNRIVCVRTMRSEIMTHRTLPLGREGRWQHESSPWSGSGWRLCVMVHCSQGRVSLMQYNYRRREEAFRSVSVHGRTRACHARRRGSLPLQTASFKNVGVGLC